ncbi:DNA helicase UvrD [Flammeovirga sp. SJP92]|nr:DNA helicase UvrD [Flammeovirga sp. SJP92]
MWPKLKPNNGQLEAIKTTEGPVLIIAGPGSGKTFTLVERVIYLITVKGVDPENIVISTFTEKAAAELLTRISNRLLELGVKANLQEMYIGTLHSIFLRLIEEYKEYTSLHKHYRILDSFDQEYMVYKNLNEFLDIEDIELLVSERLSRWPKTQAIAKLINKVSEEDISTESLINSSEIDIHALGLVYDKYLEILKQENALDFSFIQVEMLRLLERNPQVVQSLKEKLKYLMIDEYQDTNTIQEKIIFKLLNNQNNICVVGDDDQGLYRFRGATIRNILEFPQNFQKGTCKEVRININYRSHEGIIDFYNEFMQQYQWTYQGKTFRFDKTIEAGKPSDTSRPGVVKLSTDISREDWFEQVYDTIVELKEKGIVTDNNQIAFLFSSVKNQTRAIPLANYLEERGIPIYSPRSAQYFDRPEVKLLIGAFFYLFPNIWDELEDTKGNYDSIWDYYETCEVEFANKIKEDEALHNDLLRWGAMRGDEHTKMFKNTDYAFSGLFFELLQFPMFSEFLDITLKESVSDQRASYNISIFSQLIVKFEFLEKISVLRPTKLGHNLRSLFNQYFRFLRSGGMEEYQGYDEKAPSGSVSFMTIHQSKGLEFPIVFVDSLYHRPKSQHNELDVRLQQLFSDKPVFEPWDRMKYYDFYRLFYTAFSRPQNLLVLTTHEIREGKAWHSPSKLLEKSFDELPQWNDTMFTKENLVLEKVEAANIKKSYAFTSDILFYENCPLQYKFYKHLEFSAVRQAATLFGSLVHATIEDVHKAVLRGESGKVNTEQIESWFQENYNTLSISNRSYLAEPQLNAALKQVLRYKDKNESQFHRIQEAEVDVSLVKEEFILKGQIDLIKGEDGTVEIIDFKSEKKPDINHPDNRDRIERYRRQLEVYAHLVEEKTGQKVSKMNLYYTGEENGIPTLTFPNNKSSINDTIDTFEKVVSKIESNNYDMSSVNKCDKLCGNCDMRHYCNPKYPKE